MNRGIVALLALLVWFCLVLPAVWAQDSKLADGPAPPPPEDSSSQPGPTAAPAPESSSRSAPDAAGESSSRSDSESSSRPAPVDPRAGGPARPDDPEEPAPPSTPRNIRLRPSQPDPEEPAAAPPQPVLDPVGASRSLDVGTFYMKKGDYDAAIDRFKEAAERQPKLAKPYLLLGECYEKKNDPVSAVSAYRKYLQLFPKAPDEDKINKRIEKLTELQSKRDTNQH